MVHAPAATRWAKIIDQQEASGQTLRAFAVENDLNPATLAWWRSRLGRGQPRRKTESAQNQAVFDEVKVESTPLTPSDQGTVVIGLERINAHVVVDGETDLSLLRLVLDALC